MGESLDSDNRASSVCLQGLVRVSVVCFKTSWLVFIHKRTQGHHFTLKWQQDNSAVAEAIRENMGPGTWSPPAWEQYQEDLELELLWIQSLPSTHTHTHILGSVVILQALALGQWFRPEGSVFWMAATQCLLFSIWINWLAFASQASPSVLSFSSSSLCSHKLFFPFF